jgi:hypothetical protein
MVYAKVAHGVWVDWRTILGSQQGNVIPYQTNVVQGHPSISPSHPQILLQWVPTILVVAQINNSYGTMHLVK